MSGTCGTHGRNEKCVKDFGRKTSREDHLGDVGLGLYGRIILECILKKYK
jgi:hypothetical protein